MHQIAKKEVIKNFLNLRFCYSRFLSGSIRFRFIDYYCKKSGPVVQPNRTSDSGSGGRGFESRRDHKAKSLPKGGFFIDLPQKELVLRWLVSNKKRAPHVSGGHFLVCPAGHRYLEVKVLYAPGKGKH